MSIFKNCLKSVTPLNNLLNRLNSKKLLLIFLVILLYKKVSKEFFLENQNSEIQSYKIDKSYCSPQCCGTDKLWPTPNLEKKDENLENKNYLSSNFSCRGIKNSGCSCLTKEQIEYLNNRGENA